MIHSPAFRRNTRKSLLATTAALLMLVLLSACNGDPQVQQQANQYKADLDKELSQAQSVGVPNSMLQTIRQQEAQLSRTNAPLSLFSDQNVTDYYANLARRYQVLGVQVRGLISQATQQFDYQATLNLQDLASILSKRQAEGFVEAKTFADQLKQYQSLMARAQYPKDYLQIISSARETTQALHLMGPTHDDLTALQLTMRQLQNSHLDVTALQQEEQYDLQLFRAANAPEGFTQLDDLINTQLVETVAFSTQAIPYVGAAKLSQLSSEIATLKQYGQDASTFQKRLKADQTMLDQARTMGDFLKVSSQIDNDVTAIQLPLVQGQANYLLKRFHQEVTNWGNTHQYHDSYDNMSYPLDYEYDQQEGFGSDADIALQTAQTLDDYQAAINIINDDMTNLKAMEADYNDKTSWDQQHATDKQLMQYYNATTGQVIVVSLIEQTLRLYQDGKLVQAFLITSGQFAKPSPPGFWHIFLRQSPTTFKSSEPKGSAFWYPDTKINYAMEYHDDGYYFHDSWWRYYYGPGTNFPHYDPGGEEFAGTGSHGCINMRQDQAAWLYANTGYGTAVIMY